MVNKNICDVQIKKNEMEIFFISLVLLICSYNMDKNKNYNTHLNNAKVSKYLKNYNVNENVIKYVKKNYNFNGKIKYLRNNADTECMIYICNNLCYLVFIGTQTNPNDKMSFFKDIYTDLCIGLEPIDFLNNDKIKIHSKYIENMNDEGLIKNIKNYIKKHNFLDVVICGHSMGCGTGLYTSLYLAEKLKKTNFHLYTIDSPKIGNSKLNEYVENVDNLYHYDLLNHNSFAVLFPFIAPNYQHISKKIYKLNENGDIKILKNINNLTLLTNHSLYDHKSSVIIYNVYKCLK